MCGGQCVTINLSEMRLKSFLKLFHCFDGQLLTPTQKKITAQEEPQ